MKRILSLVLALILAISISGISVCAETYSDKAIIILSKKNVNVGDTVTVTISQTSSYAMAAIEGDLQYNNSVLQFVSGESGNTANKGSTVKIVKDSAPTNSISVSVKFKAIAAGSGSLSYSGKSYSDEDDGKAAAGTAITVKEKELSKNNNLGSLKINHGTLTPAFKSGKLDYTVSVKYDVTNVTISANAEAGDAKVAGVGTFDLKVGDNKRSITVTAASGDKKTYTIKIKRAAEEKPKDEDKDKEKEETEDEKQEDELENNPLSFPNGEVDYFIVADISDMPDFEGYTKDTLEIEDTKVGYYKDNSGKYNLVWATDKNGENGGFFNREANDDYTKVNYLQDEGRIYIIEPFDSDININTQFVPSTQEVSGERIECYRYVDLELKDYCVFCCYLNGENDYYKLNTKDNTVQLEPEFIYVAQKTDAQIDDLASTASEAEKSEENVIANFKNLGTQAKLLILLLCLSGLIILVLVVLIIIKAASGKKTENGFEEDDAAEGLEIERIIDETEDEEHPDDFYEEEQKPEKKEEDEPAEEPEEEELQEEKQAFEPEDETVSESEENSPENEEVQNEPDETAADDEVDEDSIDTSEFLDMDDN